MANNRRFRRTALLASLALFALTGCGMGKEKQADAPAREIPLIDEYDKDMSLAGFIGAGAPEGDGEYLRNLDISFRLQVKDTSASFVIGDEEGQYGELILCELEDNSEGGIFRIHRYADGYKRSDFLSEESSFPGTEDGIYDVSLSLSSEEGAEGTVIKAGVNGTDLGEFPVPAMDVGSVGFYKLRGTDFAYVDDLKVLSGDRPVLMDDFDGSFANNLYEYNYETPAVSAFSPYYVRFKEMQGSNWLEISSGFILSETLPDPAPIFRREFEVTGKDVESAFLYLTALGSFDAELNGRKVNEGFFDPGRMSYDKHLNYVSYDVTDCIEDKNTLDITLFNGFFDRGSGYPEASVSFGSNPALKGELVVNFKNGDSLIIPTDEEFRVCRQSRYRFNDIYQGEIIDDRELQEPQWQQVLVDDVHERFLDTPVEHKENAPIVALETLTPVSVTEPVPGHFVYDFGRNFAGTIRFSLKDFAENDGLAEGEVITFRYGELINSEDMLNSDGESGTVWTLNLLTARATDYYVTGKETASEEWISFDHTYHGFRYVEVTGLPKEIPPEDISALVLSSKMAETGSFTSSSDIINKLYVNSGNSMRSNLMDVPTDCPQRDERLGWTGDAQITSLFAMYQYDALDFYRNYLKEMRLLQQEDGAFVDVVSMNERFGGHNCWGDAPVVIAWNLYLQYGDVGVLEENYDSFCRWIDYLEAKSDGYLMKSGGYRDHLSMQDTPEELTDTAWCAHSAELVSRMAGALGKETDAAKYGEIANAFKTRWQQEFVNANGSVQTGILNEGAETETGYSLGLAFDLFPEDIREAACERLKVLTEYGGYIFGPGYSGMEYYLPGLSEGGNADMAIKVLENTQPGGIAHPLAMGLTTNPETLSAFRHEDNGYRVEGSLNHAAFSAVCAYFYTDILGIKPDPEAPGYEHFYIEPATDSGLTSAEGHYDSIRGRISVSWNTQEGTISCDVPEGTTCTLRLPDREEQELSGGHHDITW